MYILSHSQVKYFNNYVYDMKRPCFPESRGGAGGKNDHSGGNQYHQRSNTGGGAWQRPPMNSKSALSDLYFGSFLLISCYSSTY